MSHSRSFADLLTEYMTRTGIGDAELARRISVNRLTLIRWREGVTERPRHREDVSRCADVLRLTPEERNGFLLAAGFDPDMPVEAPSTVGDSPLDSREDELDSWSAAPPARGMSPTRRRAAVLTAVAVTVLLSVGVALLATGLNRDDTAPAPTATASPAETPTDTSAVIAATPVPATVAMDGESLIVLAPFANYTAGAQGYNVSGRLRDRIDSELRLSGLSNARTFLWPEIIHSESEAQDVTEKSRALLTIWGEYDSGRVLARFTTAQPADRSGRQRTVNIASSPSQLPTTINVNLTGAVRYVALVTSGRVYLDQGEYDRAKAVLRRAAHPPPVDPAALTDVRYLLGVAYLDGALFDYDESILMFSFVLEEEPRSLEALNGRAVAFMRRGRDNDAELALADLTRAEAIHPDDVETHINRGLLYIATSEQGDSENAIAVYSRALELSQQAATSGWLHACGAAHLDTTTLLETLIAMARNPGSLQIVPGRPAC